MSQLDAEFTGNAEAVNVPKRKTFRSLNVSIKLGDDVGIPQALEAVEGLGELQSIAIYEQNDYNPF